MSAEEWAECRPRSRFIEPCRCYTLRINAVITVMTAKRVEEIERAIGNLTQEELEELRVWLDEYAGPRPIDQRIAKDLTDGRLDSVVESAIAEHKQGRTRPL